MSNSFGFDEAIKEMEDLATKGENVSKVVKEYGTKMRDEARNQFDSKVKTHTGQGNAGIQLEEAGDEVKVGWSARPGFHGYFFEKGFHALDNRFGKQRIRRSSKRTGRKPDYSKARATYVPPRPHMRPAFEKYKTAFVEEAQKSLE